MQVAELLIETYGRIPPLARGAVEGLTTEQLTRQVAGTNTIGWLVWHTGRVQDHHVAEVLGDDQIWVTGDWASRFGLSADPQNTGYGHRPKDVAEVRPKDVAALTDYLDVVAGRTATMLEGLVPEDLDRVVDRRWSPPVTLGVRLVSVADDGLQHLGQAAYLRGMLDL